MKMDCFGVGKVFPPGFRFHPTDEELVLFYLKGKICRRRHGDDVIGETDVYKWDPDELPGLSKLKSGDRQWFFFSPRDRKYPNGARSGRATRNGYWKVTGKDRIITCGSRSVGVKKTLVFYGGRAPNGERTDWVMHEYTMDEEELKRCRNAQDYYALYKVYKKSGAGPKNGEQYGAPFREEDWAEDELVVERPIGCKDAVNNYSEIKYLDDDKNVSCELLGSPFDPEEIMKQMVDDSMLVPPDAVVYGFSIDQFLLEEENRCSSVDHSSRGAPFSYHKPCSQQPCVQASFSDLAQSGTTQVECQAPEVVSKIADGQERCMTEEIFVEDFLELNDLVGTDPTMQNLDEPLDNLENLPIHEFDCLSELDLFHDVASFLADVGNGESQQGSKPCEFNFEKGVIDPTPHPVPILNNFGNGSVNYESHGEHPHFDHAYKSSLLLSRDEQRCAAFSTTETNEGLIPIPASGVVHENQIQYQNHDDLVGFTTATNENGSEKQRDGTTDSWLSSALWGFVESIPTTPASAADNALVNTAFKRMSSFSRIRVNARNTNAAAGNTSRNLGKSRTGFLCISLVGVMCAILWVVIGVRVLG